MYFFKYITGIILFLALVLNFHFYDTEARNSKNLNDTKTVIKVLKPNKQRRLHPNKFTNCLKIIKNLQPKLDTELAKIITSNIIKYSMHYNIDSKLIISIIYRESSFRPMIISSADCIGLMQINIKAHSELLKKHNISYQQAFHIDNNIKLGCIILKRYLNENNLKETLRRYVGSNHKSYISDVIKLYNNLKKNRGEEKWN